MRVKRTQAVLAALATTSALALGACGGDSIENADEGSSGGASAAAADCGDLNMAVNPWVGFEADAHVVGYIAETRLNCTVNYKDLDEQVSWKGFSNGSVDVVIENWGHPELEAKYFADKGDGSA
jgi:glycine betaine/proline transport system substrate-binding protein